MLHEYVIIYAHTSGRFQDQWFTAYMTLVVSHQGWMYILTCNKQRAVNMLFVDPCIIV